MVYRFMDRTFANQMHTGSGFGNPLGTATVYPSATGKKHLSKKNFLSYHL